MNSMSRILGVAVVIGVGLAVALPRAQGDGAMNKSLERFTIGDLFPKVTAGWLETSAAWKTASDNARSLASGRNKDIQAALAPVKDEVDKAKADAKAAEKRKDFAAAGAAEGRAKTGAVVVGLLERLKDIADRQEAMATKWAQAADQMRRFTDIDQAFDRYRTAGIARPEPGQPDHRMNAEGYEAFRQHAASLKDFGTALSQLGDTFTSLGSDRLKFASELEKGGHIKSK
jgi:hypothetical protein